MKKITQTAFAAVNMNDPKHICAWTVCGTAGGVRRTVGKAWLDEDPKEGWRAAKIEGFKVVKITMTTPSLRQGEPR